MGKIIKGHVLDVLKDIESGSVDCVVTSPPYYSLRDYSVDDVVWDGNIDCEHNFDEKGICIKCGAWKGQLGQEPTHQLYVKHMVDIMREIKRVLKDTGTLFLNLGDTYTNSYLSGNGIRKKSLMMIPERVALGMIEDGWILRNKMVWYKRNAMPTSSQDRFSGKWEVVYFFAKSEKYYFNLDSVRVPFAKKGIMKDKQKTLDMSGEEGHMVGANPGDVLDIPTTPHNVVHEAVYPEKLVEFLVKAGCPKEVCISCGKPKLPFLVKTGRKLDSHTGMVISTYKPRNTVEKIVKAIGSSSSSVFRTNVISEKVTKWKASCNCGTGFKSGVVLDPFAGSGTTLLVAQDLGFDWLGIEVSSEYVDIIKQRLKVV